mmetsp:Transcript_2067/g.5683  ORF Transcript_2067/g.5683 Transcript_2067/m.5683 type:complete len:215 (-) Transcript_2067:1075-1719(-)
MVFEAPVGAKHRDIVALEGVEVGAAAALQRLAAAHDDREAVVWTPLVEAVRCDVARQDHAGPAHAGRHVRRQLGLEGQLLDRLQLGYVVGVPLEGRGGHHDVAGPWLVDLQDELPRVHCGDPLEAPVAEDQLLECLRVDHEEGARRDCLELALVLPNCPQRGLTDPLLLAQEARAGGHFRLDVGLGGREDACRRFQGFGQGPGRARPLRLLLLD